VKGPRGVAASARFQITCPAESGGDDLVGGPIQFEIPPGDVRRTASVQFLKPGKGTVTLTPLDNTCGVNPQAVSVDLTANQGQPAREYRVTVEPLREMYFNGKLSAPEQIRCKCEDCVPPAPAAPAPAQAAPAAAPEPVPEDFGPFQPGVKPLAEGGFGQVHKLTAEGIDTAFIQKTALEKEGRDTTQWHEYEMFRAANRFGGHRCICKVIGVDDQGLRLVIENLPKGNLRDFIKKYGGNDDWKNNKWNLIKYLLTELLEGLHHLHTLHLLPNDTWDPKTKTVPILKFFEPEGIYYPMGSWATVKLAVKGPKGLRVPAVCKITCPDAEGKDLLAAPVLVVVGPSREKKTATLTFGAHRGKGTLNRAQRFQLQGRRDAGRPAAC